MLSVGVQVSCRLRGGRAYRTDASADQIGAYPDDYLMQVMAGMGGIHLESSIGIEKISIVSDSIRNSIVYWNLTLLTVAIVRYSNTRNTSRIRH